MPDEIAARQDATFVPDRDKFRVVATFGVGIGYIVLRSDPGLRPSARAFVPRPMAGRKRLSFL